MMVNVNDLSQKLHVSADEMKKILVSAGVDMDQCQDLTAEQMEFIKGMVGKIAGLQEAAQVATAYGTMANGLTELNTMRGGAKGFKGFVGEELEAANATVQGRMTTVINDNGIADLEYIGKNGHHYLRQVKMGYKPGQIDFSKYKGQVVEIDKGNIYFKELQAEGAKHGVKVVEAGTTKEAAENLAEVMQTETAMTGAETAVLTPRLAAAHMAGMKAAKAGATVGGGFSLGANLVDVVCGDKSVSDAAADVTVDTACSCAAGYAMGAAGSVIGSTSLGATAIGAAQTAAATVAGTTAGSAILGTAAAGAGLVTAGATAAVGAIGAAGATLGAGAVAATTAIAGAGAGAAVATGVAAAGAAAACVGAAAVAAAPAVVAGAVVCGVCRFFKSIF